MLERAEIKKITDDWQSWFQASKNILVARSQKLSLPKNNALAITGVRRCGKTFAAVELAKNFQNVLYVNFEDPSFYQDNSVRNLDNIISVYTEYSGTAPGMVLFDEIQNIDGWERWARKAVDMKKWPLVITGSSSRLLGSEISTAISGRCIEKQLWPLSLGEYITFTGSHGGTSLSQDGYLAALRSYMRWGGFPQCVQSASEADKTELLRQYMNDLVYKDIINRHKIRTKRNLDQMTGYYLANISKLHSYSGLKKAFGISTETSSEYGGFLEEAFLFFEVKRFHPNQKVQSRDPKKIYVIDTGLRNANTPSGANDTGKLAENIVYVHLRRKGCGVRYFSENRETDFVVMQDGEPVDAIQVCYSDMQDAETYRREVEGLCECLEKTKLQTGLILTLNREETIRRGNKRIKFVPLYKWLLQ
ncbi:MAG: hypothetical protein A2583_07790 [Bdellovibrionales bacterium RIFOXYD1_FULL_53_11]|nr:MAG: hypothetical protein A2583_07790 [Bdellovibrionales bacterium RIFOXYD1_FULL_53_11]